MSTRAAVLCVLFPHCCAMSTFSTLLRNFYFFPRCCDISLLSTLLRNVSTFSLLLCSVYFFHDAAPCLLIQRSCVISALTTLLCHVYLSTLLHFVYRDMYTLSTLLRHAYFFQTAKLCQLLHATVPCLPFLHSCAMSPLSMLLRHV